MFAVTKNRFDSRVWFRYFRVLAEKWLRTAVPVSKALHFS